MMRATIPFSGFYESHHNSAMSDALERMFQDDSGDIHPELAQAASDALGWSRAFALYAGAYAKHFCEEFDIGGTFEKMVSPREYNFDTDVLYITLSEAEVARIVGHVDPARLAQLCRDKFTSRSGFISFYSPDWESWGDFRKWDHHQVGAVIEAYMIQQCEEDKQTTPCDWELYSMDWASEGGQLDNWLLDGQSDEVRRLLKIHDYLRAREKRNA